MVVIKYKSTPTLFTPSIHYLKEQ